MRTLIALALAGTSMGASFLLMRTGLYGFTIFVLLPMVLGGLAAWCLRPKTPWGAAGAGGVTVMFATSLLLVVGMEGGICILMSLPLVTPLGMLGGWLAYMADSRRASAGSAVALLLLPVGTLGWDANAKPPVYAVRTAMEIAATPEVVWKNVVTFSELPPPHEWYFRAGLAYPERSRITGTGPGAIRYCEFSTGPFVEPIEIWNEPHLLRFRVTANPAPMHEWSPYAQVLPKHLHGYLISKQGQFRLTPLANGHTLLEGTTWYQHGLWPAQYWRLWSNAIIHRVHLRVLTHIKTLSEATAAQ